MRISEIDQSQQGRQQLRQRAMSMLTAVEELAAYAETLPKNSQEDPNPRSPYNDDAYRDFEFLEQSAVELDALLWQLIRATRQPNTAEIEQAVTALVAWNPDYARQHALDAFDMISDILVTIDQGRPYQSWLKFMRDLSDLDDME
jgi:hypothetical protein